jgi:(heptosyl)LPS beta-1,4-glucosyltransferase
VRLGGFVIHGNNADTLARCLDSLVAVADDVVAVDSCSTDGSARVVASRRGIRRLVRAWEGYGAARAAAVEALPGCDYYFFLDSDEWLRPDAVEALRAWKASAPEAPHHSLVLRDWADLPTGGFLFRTERRVRLVRRDHAVWTREMIVHEALPRATTVKLPIAFEHRFATGADSLRDKMEGYALLWAIKAHHEGRRPKPAGLQRAAHVLRDALVKGALFRGGLAALPLCEAMAHYHARKHELLRALRRGEHAELVRAYAEGRNEDVVNARVPQDHRRESGLGAQRAPRPSGSTIPSGGPRPSARP